MTHSPSSQVHLGGYIGTYIALVVLATGSLLMAGLPDALAVTLALVIAVIKAVLVLYFFMHLREEAFSFRFVMLVAASLVCIFIGLTVLDPVTRSQHPPAPSHNRQYPHEGRIGWSNPPANTAFS